MVSPAPPIGVPGHRLSPTGRRLGSDLLASFVDAIGEEPIPVRADGVPVLLIERVLNLPKGYGVRMVCEIMCDPAGTPAATSSVTLQIIDTVLGPIAARAGTFSSQFDFAIPCVAGKNPAGGLPPGPRVLRVLADVAIGGSPILVLAGALTTDVLATDKLTVTP